ncbi:FGGY family carbohydrate kinase [Mycolicibacterium komossense]|uniref:ATP:glycerol 3-phosphotransferase n=1 Tax=Mycolicibacterium komossense TaxID=1779 RepID=A0ABT3C6L0_9MYCO|nr:glycerol kinase GlpK [Mycolicibacterium komossense]MCV7225118.1 glycerol kinase GlpK [Mycolicibacterium komossense]
MADYILGIDEGTTSARAFVIDENTTVHGFAQAELTQIYPRPGWIEHDPMQILNTQLEVIRAALRDAGITPDQLRGVGLTNQRETAVVWEKDTGRPIYNAVVWASRHSVEVVDKWVSDGIGDLIQERTGLIPDAYYTGSKIRWILDRVPGAQERAERGELLAGTVDTWLIWNLTGRKSFVTDYSNASRTMMMDLKTLQWDQELLNHYGIPRCMLAEIMPSDSHFGDLEATFGAAVPIGSNLGDQQAGLFGQAAYQPGRVKMTYGTAGVLNINCGATPLRVEGLTPSVAWGVQGKVAYEVEGVLFSMGKTMQWLRDDLQLIHAAPDSEWYAGQVATTEGVYLIPAFTGLAAPTWDPHARAAIIGMSNSTTRLHIIRAAVESMVYQTRDVVEAALAGSDIKIPELRIDGGAVKNNLLCQLQADILGIPVIRPRNPEATIFGAMLLAGLSTGVYASLDEVESKWVVDRVFEPQMSADRADELYSGWRAARELTKGWAHQVTVA